MLHKYVAHISMVDWTKHRYQMVLWLFEIKLQGKFSSSSFWGQSLLIKAPTPPSITCSLLTMTCVHCSLGKKAERGRGGLQSLRGDNTPMTLWLFCQQTKETLGTFAQLNELLNWWWPLSAGFSGQSDSKGLVVMPGSTLVLFKMSCPPLILLTGHWN